MVSLTLQNDWFFYSTCILKNKVKKYKYLSNYVTSCFQVSIELNFGFFNIVVGVNNSDSLGVGDR